MNKTLKYIVLLAIACFVSKGYAQELKSEVFSLLNLDYPGLEKVKALHQEGKDEDAAKALLDYYRARTNVKTPDINLNKVTISKEEQQWADDGGRQDLARRSYRVLCASVDADSRGRQVRVAGLGDAPLQQILRVARLFLVALPQEALQPRHQSQRRRASVRRDGPLRAVPADGHLSDAPAQSDARGRYREDGEPRYLRGRGGGFRALRVRRSVEDRDAADHPRRY